MRLAVFVVGGGENWREFDANIYYVVKFVHKIKRGEYKDYYTKKINGLDKKPKWFYNKCWGLGLK